MDCGPDRIRYGFRHPLRRQGLPNEMARPAARSATTSSRPVTTRFHHRLRNRRRPSEICERFSKRRAEVEGISQFIQSHGREPTPGEVHAITVATRNPKLAEITTPAVLAAQRDQLTPTELKSLRKSRDRAIARSQEPDHDLGLGREETSLSFATAHLYERRSVAKGHEVLAEALNQSLGYQEFPASAGSSRTKPISSWPRAGQGLDPRAFRDQSGPWSSRNGPSTSAVNTRIADANSSPWARKNPEVSSHLSPEQQKAAKEVTRLRSTRSPVSAAQPGVGNNNRSG